MDFHRFYEHGTYNLTGSLLRHFGLEGAPSLPILDQYLAKGYRNVFVLLMDGLSVGLVKTNSYLTNHLVDEIYSVYPPTTTASLTTLYSGLSPIEHGWMGWNVCLPQLPYPGVTLFLNTIMDTDQPAADFNVAQRYLAYESIFEKLRASGISVLHTSPFNEPRSSSVDQIFSHFIEQSRKPGRNFGFGYWTEPDYTQHEDGAMSVSAIRIVQDLALSIKVASEILKDSLLILISDHGMIDSEPAYLEDYPKLNELLRQPFSFEPRHPSFFVIPGKEDEFSRLFRQSFSDFDLYTHDEALASGMYGPGTAHETTSHSIGDFVAIARGGRHLVNSRSLDKGFKGLHAGLTPEEMMVPLVIWECK